MAEDYYKALGVGRDASQAEIHKSYLELARKLHPDVNPEKSAKQKFQEVQRAFDVLNDPSKRELYDRYGSSFENVAAAQARGQAGQGQSGGTGGFDDFDFSQFFGEKYGAGANPMGGFADIFSQFRRASAEPGGRPGRASPRERATPLRQDMEIPLATSVLGGEVELSVRRPSGKVETIKVKIPAGIDEGKEIRLRGQGEEGLDGTRGDILLRVRLAPHPWFTRREKNLYVKLPVSLAEAAAGAKVDVPTPYGTVSVRVPPGTSSGAKLRIKGHGIKPKSGEPGDLFAEIQVMLPKSLDEPTLERLREIERQQPLEPRRDLRW